MIDKPITSKLALLLYNVYKANYCTCLAIQELEEKAKKYDEFEEENKVLVEGVKEIKCYMEIDNDNKIIKIRNNDNDKLWLCYEPLDYDGVYRKQFCKIKAMLELVEASGNE